MSNLETKQELEITINVERKVTWTRQETITVKGTRDECLAEAERIEELDAEEQIRLVAEHKDEYSDGFLYNERHWDYSEEEFNEEQTPDYDESTLEEEDIYD
tara:strand:+ start:1882 stop:2187 length:306 start_codon:yes stop_codon:yes gene_type:complete